MEKTFLILDLLALKTSTVDRVSVLSPKSFYRIVNLVFENCLKEKVMTPNQWMETAFHLCKQRWDSSIEWMETLPMSKISLMMGIQSSFMEKMRNDAKGKG